MEQQSKLIAYVKDYNRVIMSLNFSNIIILYHLIWHYDLSETVLNKRVKIWLKSTLLSFSQLILTLILYSTWLSFHMA